MAGGEERNQNNCLRFSLIMIGFAQGVARQQLELLGPILAHVIRPLVWVRGLWSIELEKVWKSIILTNFENQMASHLWHYRRGLTCSTLWLAWWSWDIHRSWRWNKVLKKIINKYLSMKLLFLKFHQKNIKTQNGRKISQSILLEKIFSNLFSGGRGFSKPRRDSNPQRYLGGDIETGLHIDLIFYEETKSVQKN